MSAERIYNLLEAEVGGENQNSWDDKSQNGGESQSNSDSKPGRDRQVLDAPEPSEVEGQSVEEQARDWQIAVEQAESVARLGKMQAGAMRSVESSKAAQVDWREPLRRAISVCPLSAGWPRINLCTYVTVLEN
jgi:predicted metal-dependent peptidase